MRPSLYRFLLTPIRHLLMCVSLVVAVFPATAEEDSAHAQARKKTAPYYQDAQICRSRSKVEPMPEGADPAITIDATKYLACINQMGYRQDAKTDPLLVALHRCHNQKTRGYSASGEIIHHAPSQAQVRACLTTRGFPSAGSPPQPNAPVSASVAPAAHDASAKPKLPSLPQLGSSPKSASDGDVQTIVIPPRK